MKNQIKKSNKKSFLKKGLLCLAFIGAQMKMSAQAAGIDAASSEISSYIDPIGNMIIVIGAVIGLVGGIRVFIKWNNGDQDTNKAIMSWFGSCIFLVLVGVVIRAFFGV